MADAKLKATIDGKALKVGANPQPKGSFQVSIRNATGAAIKRTGKGTLYLRGTLGPGKDALFFDETDARAANKGLNLSGWRIDWDFSGKNDGKFALKMYTFNTTLFNKDDVLTLTVSGVITKTAPGPAALSFESDLADGPQPLTIDKMTDLPDIISFYSIPPEGVNNLPRASVVLRWRTYELSNVQLTRIGYSVPLAFDIDGDESTMTVTAGDIDQQFRLSGYDGARQVERILTVSALRSGWYTLSNIIREGDPGYPVPATEAEADMDDDIALEPALLLNANDQHLYVIFKHTFEEEERALLFEAENPFGGWRFVPSSVPDEDGFVPQGFGTSPGVYLDDKIWLIGGSQVDPDNTSNGIWCFDPKAGGAWQRQLAPEWRKRMGHAVLLFDGKIWVLGGRDEAGNALNDVWTLDIRNGNRKWVHQTDAPWRRPDGAVAGRCLFAPAVFDNKIWIYGGMKEPFSDVLYDDLYLYQGGQWAKRDITGILTGANDSRRPIASSLQAFKNQLFLFGTFRTVKTSDKSEIVEQLAFRLSQASSGTWTKVADDGLQNWGAVTSFSYQSVNLKDRMLLARVLAYGESHPLMKVYVPA